VSEEVETVSILDVTGKVLQTTLVNASKLINFDLSAVANGLYYVRISSANNSVVKQIVKN
jgi:hypothetical protein